MGVGVGVGVKVEVVVDVGVGVNVGVGVVVAVATAYGPTHFLGEIAQAGTSQGGISETNVAIATMKYLI